LPTQVYYIGMTVSHLSGEISYFGKNFRKTDVLFHVGLLKLNYEHIFMKNKDILLSEV